MARRFVAILVSPKIREEGIGERLMVSSAKRDGIFGTKDDIVATVGAGGRILISVSHDEYFVVSGKNASLCDAFTAEWNLT